VLLSKRHYEGVYFRHTAVGENGGEATTIRTDRRRERDEEMETVVTSDMTILASASFDTENIHIYCQLN
jgi:hypothetical protein